MNRCKLRNTISSRISVSWNTLPADILCLIFDLACARTVELRTFSLVSMEMSTVISLTNKNEWAPIWENEFRHQEPALSYAFIIDQLGSRSKLCPNYGWRGRLQRLKQMKEAALAEPLPLRYSFYFLRFRSTVRAKVVDVLLKRESDVSFAVNLGTKNSVVWLYGTRRIAKDTEAPFSERALASYSIPTYVAGATNPSGPLGNVFVLCSINGKAVSEHKNFNELQLTILQSGEFARWRLIYYPASVDLNKQIIPPQCRFTKLPVTRLLSLSHFRRRPPGL
jgi:hypothetical protein